MGPLLEALLELQDIELQIVDIRRQLAQKERLVKRQTARLNDAQDRLTTERESLRRKQMDLDELDVELKARSANVIRLREQLNSVRTNKEYAAVLSQLNNEKADSQRIETKAMEIMEAVEAQKKVVAEREEETQQEQGRLDDFQAQSNRSQQTFSDKLNDLLAARERAIAGVDPKVLTLFDRISERYEGEVMAKVSRTHPRRDEFACGGCHMTLSAEYYNSLLVRDEVLTCGNCGRILFVEKRG